MIHWVILFTHSPSINYFPEREKMWIHHCHLSAPPIIGPSSCKQQKKSDCKHPHPPTPQPGWRAFPIESVCGGRDKEVNNTKIFVWNWNYFPKENDSIVLLLQHGHRDILYSYYKTLRLQSPTPPPPETSTKMYKPTVYKRCFMVFPLRHYETAHSHLK